MNAILLSIGIWVAGTLLTVILFFADLFLTIVLPWDKKRKAVHAQCFWWSEALIHLNPYWSITTSGLKNIDHNKTYVIVANHQSIADIIVLYKIRMQFKWVAKEGILKVPFLGWCLYLGKHIRLSRRNFGSIRTVYRKAAEWLRGGMSVAFFPEGTRSNTDEMNSFQNGAFKLAIKEKIPILPVAISGTREAIPKGDWIFKKKVAGQITVLPAIETRDFKPGDFANLRDIVRDRIKEASA